MENLDKKNEKEFYNKIGSLMGWDFSRLKYEVIDNSSFQYFDEINSQITEQTILLDIGTGGGEKLTNLISNKCLLKVGTDFSEEMIKVAKENNKNNKIRFFKMNSETIKFPNEFFDIICARHMPFNFNEIHRLLNDNGMFFSEQIDEEDCKSLKELFGRGQGYNTKLKLIDKMRKEVRQQKIENVEFFEIEQQEYYKTEEDLLFLLKNTPIVPNFGEEKNDYQKFNEYVKKNRTDKGIALRRMLFGIKMKKKYYQ